nr:heterokaryon incompatibility protein 6, or allele [Quercus suber]
MNGPRSPYKETRSYQYTPLDASTHAVRLMELLPGQPDDDIHIRMHQVALPSKQGMDQHSQRRSARAELQTTLSDGWVVRETLQGRFLFEKLREYAPDEPYETSWRHPFTGQESEMDAVSCHLDSETPKFEALSHAWGPKGDDRLVFVEPATPTLEDPGPLQTVRIRRDLERALRHLRQREQSRMLWIDMICINQDDIVERGHQVKHMRLVYQLAHRVIVWIGTEEDRSSIAFSVLNHLGQQVEFVQDGTWRVNAPGCDEPTWSRAAVPLPYDLDTWQAVAKIIQRPWFQRLWVLQEAKLASNQSIIQCGEYEMPLRRFGNAIWCAAVKAEGQTSGLQAQLFDAGDATVPQLDGPFMTTLLRLNQKACLDPRDRVYGALGLAPQSLASRIIPDYTRPVADVYKDFCLALCGESGRMEFLLSCDLSRRTINGPTWVPDWSIPITRTARWSFSSCRATGISVPVFSYTRDQGNTLEVKGVKCGTVHSVKSTAPDCPDAIASVLDDWAPFSDQCVYLTGENALDAFVKTIRWEFLLERFPKEPHFPTLKTAKTLLKRVQDCHVAADDCSCAGEDSNASCAAHLFPEVRGRTFFETDEGYMGMTSAAVSANDIVCVILGCSMPMILRPDRHGRFRIVGASLVHGLMDAESLLGPLEYGWSVKIGAHSGWYGAINYDNLNTGVSLEEDPRLGELPSCWEKLQAIRTPIDPLHFARYRHLATEKSINGDPSNTDWKGFSTHRRAKKSNSRAFSDRKVKATTLQPHTIWQFEERDISRAPSAMILVRILVGKVASTRKLESVLRSTPIKGTQPGCNCVTWVAEALRGLDMDGKASGRSATDWTIIRNAAMCYVESKRSQHRFDGQGQFDPSKVATWDLIEDKEGVP